MQLAFKLYRHAMTAMAASADVMAHRPVKGRNNDMWSRWMASLQAQHKSEKEARLLSASKTFDAGLQRFDLSHWDDILDEHCVLHKDKLTLQEDIHGIGAVRAFFQVNRIGNVFKFAMYLCIFDVFVL